MTTPPQLSVEFVARLRCPVALKTNPVAADPGKLTLAHDGAWLVCEESGCKYPVIDGLPHLLVEVGKRWQAVAVADLPVPPPQE
ncbi:MAG: Trm112 family protein [Phototrophicaceae bacterium]|jgi:uncharacterized protein YbaR (Trm112 family)